MDSTILAALVGGGCTLIAPPLTLMVSKYLEHRKLPVIPMDRRNALRGAWKGTLNQKLGSRASLGNAPIYVQLDTKGKRVFGEATVTYEDSENLTGSLDKGVFDGRILRIDYRHHDSDVINYGTIYAELSSSGKVLSGLLIGYGLESDRLVYGSFELNKIA